MLRTRLLIAAACCALALLALPAASSAQTGSGTSTVTQADCDAGRIQRHGRTLTRAECQKLIGQRVNLAQTGFEAWMFAAAGGLCLLAGFGLRRRRAPQLA